MPAAQSSTYNELARWEWIRRNGATTKPPFPAADAMCVLRAALRRAGRHTKNIRVGKRERHIFKLHLRCMRIGRNRSFCLSARARRPDYRVASAFLHEYYVVCARSMPSAVYVIANSERTHKSSSSYICTYDEQVNVNIVSIFSSHTKSVQQQQQQKYGGMCALFSCTLCVRA